MPDGSDTPPEDDLMPMHELRAKVREEVRKSGWDPDSQVGLALVDIGVTLAWKIPEMRKRRD